ncbi:MAG: acetate kinase [Candidatus Omnitrophota bacterium]|jgi:acetate kinase
MKILIINSGSSSIKYRFFDIKNDKVLCKGIIERIGSDRSGISHDAGKGRYFTGKVDAPDHHKAIRRIFDILISPKLGVMNSWSDISAIGHRVVHGAEKFKGPVLINKAVIKIIEGFNELAPLHNPPAVLGIKACIEFAKDIPQAAVFDTAFHQTIPAYAYTYGIPYEFYKRYKIRRYGFHGTSHKYVSQQAAGVLKKPLSRLNLVTCHLGNGCSITAVKSGKSVDTSMGFTPLEGLLMGTRSGDIDPAAVLFIMEREGLSIKDADYMLNKKSGILGLSGTSNDMRDILKRLGKGDRMAGLILDIFVYRIIKYIGAYTASMNSVDAVVLTGGIGENSAIIRRMIARRIKGFLSKFRARLLVIPTDEEWMIAKETSEIIKVKKR